MAYSLYWSPTSFFTQKLNPAKRFLRKTGGASIGLSAGRTWTTSLDVKAEYLGHYWRPFRFDMGALATGMTFVQMHPTGGSLNTDVNTAAVNPVIETADIG